MQLNENCLMLSQDEKKDQKMFCCQRLPDTLLMSDGVHSGDPLRVKENVVKNMR